MATWAEQNVPDQLRPIPRCPYIVRKGQEPDFSGKSNILPWQEALQYKSDKWEPLMDGTKFVKELPPTVANNTTNVAVTHIAPQEQSVVDTQPPDMREVQVYAVFDELEPDDIKPNGLPKVDVIRSKSGLDLTGTEIKDMWLEYQKAKE